MGMTQVQWSISLSQQRDSSVELRIFRLVQSQAEMSNYLLWWVSNVVRTGLNPLALGVLYHMLHVRKHAWSRSEWCHMVQLWTGNLYSPLGNSRLFKIQNIRLLLCRLVMMRISIVPWSRKIVATPNRDVFICPNICHHMSICCFIHLAIGCIFTRSLRGCRLLPSDLGWSVAFWCKIDLMLSWNSCHNLLCCSRFKHPMGFLLVIQIVSVVGFYNRTDVQWKNPCVI